MFFLKNNNVLQNANINNVYNLGFYSIRGGTGLPQGASLYGSLLVSRADLTIDSSNTIDTDSIQLYMDSDNKMYMRHCIDRSWSSWEQVGAQPTYVNYSNGKVIKYPNNYTEEVITYTLNSTECDFTSGSSPVFGGKTITISLNGTYSSAVNAVANCENKGYLHCFVSATTSNAVYVRLSSPTSVPSSSLTGAKVTVFVKGN